MQLKKKRTKSGVPYDIWDTNMPKAKSPKANKTHPSTKRTTRTALPHPGQSYNPDPEDHANLLNKIAAKELKFQKHQASIRRANKGETDVNINDLKKHEHDEMVSGIRHLIDGAANDSGDETNSVYSDYDEKDYEAIKKPKKVEEKRKTKKQRLGQLRDRLQRKAAKLKKLKNIRMAKFDSLKKIAKQLDKKSKEDASKQVKKHRTIKNERLATKFEPSDPIYCLSSELPSSLREVSCPMNAIVRERLESFQARLLVEPTSIQVKKRKFKKKVYERQTADERER